MEVKLKSPVAINMRFIFNAGDPWDSQAEFEKFLADALASKNLEGKVVNTLNGSESIVFICKEVEIEDDNEEDDKPTTPPSKQIRRLIVKNKNG